jgi:hypothetical protein
MKTTKYMKNKSINVEDVIIIDVLTIQFHYQSSLGHNATALYKRVSFKQCIAMLRFSEKNI